MQILNQFETFPILKSFLNLKCHYLKLKGKVIIYQLIIILLYYYHLSVILINK